MRQFCTIFGFEIKSFFKNKVFVGLTVFFVLLIAAVMMLPKILDFEETTEPGDVGDRPVMLVQTDDADRGEAVLEAFKAAFPHYSVRLADGDASLKDSVEKGEAECAFAVTDPASYVYYVNSLSLYDFNTETAGEALRDLYRREAMVSGGIDPASAAEILAVEAVGETVCLGSDQASNFGYTYIMIFALYMVILLYGQMIATNVATEKSSRAMELLVTSAKPTAMMFGKVLASCLAGFTQLAAVFGSAVVFYRLSGDSWSGNFVIQSIFGMPTALFGYLLVFFVLGFLIYAFLYGAIGSTVSKIEDINTAVMPISMLFVVGFMVVMFSMSSGAVDNTAMRICSFVPFTSPMAMFTRIAMSSVPLPEILASIAVLICSVTAIGVISARIYRVGVLLYGTRPKFSAILKFIK